MSVLVVTCLSLTAHAEPLVYGQSFYGHEGAKKVGMAASINGGDILVGVPNWGSPGPKSATLYDAATGDVIRTFAAPADRWFGDFGRRVVLGQTRVLVCGDSYGDGPNEDRPVFLFDRVRGDVVMRIPNPHAEQGNATGFGDDCVYDGTQVLIGAARYDGAFKDEGVAYLFDAATGDMVHTFRSPAPTMHIKFGRDVALWGPYAAVSQTMHGGRLGDPGAVHLFDRVSGALVHTFTRPSASSGLFGTSVHMDDGNLLIGSAFDDAGGQETGLAFLFDLETKEQVMRFAAPDGHENTSFGGDVVLYGDYALIGANDVAIHGRNSGAAYLFRLSTGHLEQELFGPRAESGAYFGTSVDLGPDGAVIGAFEDSTLHDLGGAVHYFRPIEGRLGGTVD